MPSRGPVRSAVYGVVDGERDYQESKWGEGGKNRTVPEYILFMEHHLEKARRIASTVTDTKEALDSVRKVTALGIACMEENGAPRREGY